MERRLWTGLSNRKCAGWKFCRQMPLGLYTVDFLCREARLVVEADGWSHDLRQKEDVYRDKWLIGEGYRVLRFSNTDISENLDGVLHVIAETLGPPPNPSRKREGRE